MLNDADGCGSSEPGIAQRGQQRKEVGVAIGRVGEDKIKLLAVERGDGARGLSGNNEALLAETKRLGIMGQTGASLAAGFDEGNVGGAAGETLKPHATGAGEEIKDAAAGDPRAENVEKRRAHAVGRRPDVEAGRGGEAAAAEGTGNNADHSDVGITIWEEEVRCGATQARGTRESWVWSGQGDNRPRRLERK